LHERQDFAHFVERAETAREDHERACEMREPELAHEKIVELERELPREIGIGELLPWEDNVEPDRFRARFFSPAIGPFHDSRTATGADDVSVGIRRQALGPPRDEPRELAGVV